MAAPDFWDNQELAQKIVGELSFLKTTLTPLGELLQAAGDLEVLVEFLEDDETGETEAELKAAIEDALPQVDAVELQAMMSAPEDRCDAFVSVQAGEGGTDSSDWAEMLMRMYQRWSEQRRPR